jgi:aquaporin Z
MLIKYHTKSMHCFTRVLFSYCIAIPNTSFLSSFRYSFYFRLTRHTKHDTLSLIYKFIFIFMQKSRYIMEGLGAFVLTLVVALGILGPIGAGLVLAGAIYFGAHISGAHYNPAVTLAFWLRKKLSNIEAFWYVFSQITGGVLASVVANFMVKDTQLLPPRLEALTPNLTSAALAEIIFTAILVYTVLMVATNKKLAGNWYYGLAIGFVVLIGGIFTGGISGGALNPAVGIGILVGNSIASMFVFAGKISSFVSPNIDAIMLYTFAPLAGGFLASYLYTVTQEKHSEK